MRPWRLKIEIYGDENDIKSALARIAKVVADGQWDNPMLHTGYGGGGGGGCAFSQQVSLFIPDEEPLTANEIRGLRKLLK